MKEEGDEVCSVLIIVISLIRSIIAHYLNYQHLRRYQGFPPELQELARLTEPWNKHGAPPPHHRHHHREPSQTITSGSRGSNYRPVSFEGVKRGKISRDGLSPLMSGTSYRRQTFNTEDNQWESYRNMELKGPQPRRSRNDNQWVEENVNESYSSWPRQPQQFQDPGFSQRNSFPSRNTRESFGTSSGFRCYDSAPNPDGQIWSRMNNHIGNNIASTSSPPNRGRDGGCGRRW